MQIADSVNGAIMISVIDFILSFVFIAGIGALLSLFPLLNKLGTIKEDSLKGHH